MPAGGSSLSSGKATAQPKLRRNQRWRLLMKVPSRSVQVAARRALCLARVAAIGFLVAAHRGFAQAAPDSQDVTAQPAFEVVSVKSIPGWTIPLFRVDHGKSSRPERGQIPHLVGLRSAISAGRSPAVGEARGRVAK